MSGGVSVASLNPKPDAPVHRCPPDGSDIMPCCGRTPFEVPGRDRISIDASKVTCSARSGLESETETP